MPRSSQPPPPPSAEAAALAFRMAAPHLVEAYERAGRALRPPDDGGPVAPDDAPAGRPSSAPQVPSTLSVREAAARLGVSERHLRTLRQLGEIVAVESGRRVLFTEEALGEYLRANAGRGKPPRKRGRSRR